MTTPPAPQLAGPLAATAGVWTLTRMLFKRAPRPALAALALLVFGHALEGATLLLLLPLLQLMQRRDEGWAIEVPVGDWFGADAAPLQVGLVGVLAALCVAILLQAIFTRVKNVALGRLLFTTVSGLRRDLFESVGRTEWRQIAEMRGADLVHSLSAEIDRLHSGVFSLLMLAQSIVFIAIYVGISLLISPAMTLFAALFGVAALVLLQPVRNRAARYGASLSEQRREQNRIVSEFVAGVKVAKSFNAEQQYLDGLNAVLDRSQLDFERYARTSATSSALLQVANALSLSAFVYVALEVLALPLARIVVLILLFMRLSPRFTALQANLQDILVNAPVLRALEDLKRRCDAAREPERQAGEAPQLRRELRFDDVSFGYESRGSETAIAGASFAIPAGAVVALIGHSGAGKSTLADLLLGLLTPRSGSMSVDGERLDENNRRAWRDRTAYVPQEAFLLHDTIAANLRLGASSAKDEALWEVLRAVGAEPIVSKLPAGLATVAGDRGAQLSGGERQRIALARALLRRPQLLVLDEATNALDRESQAHITKAIMALRGATTVIIIAHGPAAVADADIAITLNAGRVVEFGPIATLSSDPESHLARFLGTRAEM